MNIDDLIQTLEEAREAMGGDADVRIAYQPSWPLRGNVVEVTYNHNGDPDADFAPGTPADEAICWLAAGEVGYGENPYAPRWAWDGEPVESAEECCPDCGRLEMAEWDGQCATCEPAADIKALR